MVCDLVPHHCCMLYDRLGFLVKLGLRGWHPVALMKGVMEFAFYTSLGFGSESSPLGRVVPLCDLGEATRAPRRRRKADPGCPMQKQKKPSLCQ